MKKRALITRRIEKGIEHDSAVDTESSVLKADASLQSGEELQILTSHPLGIDYDFPHKIKSDTIFVAKNGTEFRRAFSVNAENAEAERVFESAREMLRKIGFVDSSPIKTGSESINQSFSDGVGSAYLNVDTKLPGGPVLAMSWSVKSRDEPTPVGRNSENPLGFSYPFQTLLCGDTVATNSRTGQLRRSHKLRCFGVSTENALIGIREMLVQQGYLPRSKSTSPDGQISQSFDGNGGVFVSVQEDEESKDTGTIFISWPVESEDNPAPLGRITDHPLGITYDFPHRLRFDTTMNNKGTGESRRVVEVECFHTDLLTVFTRLRDELLAARFQPDTESVVRENDRMDIAFVNDQKPYLTVRNKTIESPIGTNYQQVLASVSWNIPVKKGIGSLFRRGR